MDLFDTLATTLYPTNITEHNDDMSNHYNDERNERIAESVYEIVDSLSEEAIRRLLEENLIEAAITDRILPTLSNTKRAVLSTKQKQKRS